MALEAKAYSGDLRPVFARAIKSFLGGKIVAGGDIRDAGTGALMAEYEVLEPNGTRTHRAAMAWDRAGQFEAVLYATNDTASYERYRPAALEFFASRRPGGASPERGANDAGASIVGEWYTGRISTIQRQDSVTGRMAPPAGSNMTYKFLPDGTYQQYGLTQFTYATCVNSYFVNLTGRYTLQGDTLTTTPLDGSFDTRTCGGQPVRKPAAKTVSVFTVQTAGNELKLTDNRGASGTYRRK